MKPYAARTPPGGGLIARCDLADRDGLPGRRVEDDRAARPGTLVSCIGTTTDWLEPTVAAGTGYVVPRCRTRLPW